jgi:threonine synthase
MWRGVIEAYRDRLPVAKGDAVVTLNEGNTPLIRSEKLAALAGIDVYLKCEGTNPTGSFKDRGMTVAVSKALQRGAKAILCASTGNTSASAAAYGARAGLACYVLLPEGAVALGKLSQAMICDAKVLAVRGNFDDALNLAREIGQKPGIALVNSVNPDRIEGQKTGAFEICDQLGGRAPDFHLIPVGNAGNITAYWKGYREYHEAGRSRNLPRMLGFQAKGADPIVRGRAVRRPRTFATAIRIGNPASWRSAEEARDASRGLIDSVTDREILAAYKWLASEEGLFVEPASAASVAGLVKLARKGYFRKAASGKPGATAVCVLTGSGLKDPDSALRSVRKPKALPPKAERILREIRL